MHDRLLLQMGCRPLSNLELIFVKKKKKKHKMHAHHDLMIRSLNHNEAER